MEEGRRCFLEGDRSGVAEIIRQIYIIRRSYHLHPAAEFRSTILQALTLVQGFDDLAEEAIHASTSQALSIGDRALVHTAYTWQIILLHHLGQLESHEGSIALRRLRFVSQDLPHGPEALALNLASWKLTIGDPLAAISALDGLSDPNPSHPDPWFIEKVRSTRAEALLDAHRYDDAIRQFLDNCPLVPTHGTANPIAVSNTANLGYCYARLGERRRAQETVRLITGTPGSGPGLSRLHILRARLEISDPTHQHALWDRHLSGDSQLAFGQSFRHRIRLLCLRERYRQRSVSPTEAAQLQHLIASIRERGLMPPFRLLNVCSHRT